MDRIEPIINKATNINLSRRQFLFGGAAGAALLVRNIWAGKLNESRDTPPTTQLEDGLDWNLALGNTSAEAVFPFIQPSSSPEDLKRQLTDKNVFELAVPGQGFVERGKTEGHVFVFTAYHESNMGPLIRTPQKEEYVVMTRFGLRHFYVTDDFQNATRIDDIEAAEYFTVQPYINANHITRYQDRDKSGNPITREVKNPALETRRTDRANLDAASGGVVWQANEHNAAWNALPGGQLPELSLPIPLVPVTSLLGGFVLPQGASLKDRVLREMVIHPPFHQTDPGKLLLESMGTDLSYLQQNGLAINTLKVNI